MTTLQLHSLCFGALILMTERKGYLFPFLDQYQKASRHFFKLINFHSYLLWWCNCGTKVGVVLLTVCLLIASKYLNIYDHVFLSPNFKKLS